MQRSSRGGGDRLRGARPAADMRAALHLLLALLSALAVSAPALDNGLGATPPMGFNTWNRFGCAACASGRCCTPTFRCDALLTCAARSCSITEATITGAAQALVSLGLKNVG